MSNDAPSQEAIDSADKQLGELIEVVNDIVPEIERGKNALTDGRMTPDEQVAYFKLYDQYKYACRILESYKDDLKVKLPSGEVVPMNDLIDFLDKPLHEHDGMTGREVCDMFDATVMGIKQNPWFPPELKEMNA